MDECCAGGDGDNTLTQGFVGPAVLAGHWGHGSLVLEGLPLVFLANVLLVCAWCWPFVYAAPSTLIPVLT
jgi:hypothetical protein